MSGQTPWMDFEDQWLREGLAAGKTYRVIASDIGATRSMVAGRVYRLGLKGPRSRQPPPAEGR